MRDYLSAPLELKREDMKVIKNKRSNKELNLKSNLEAGYSTEDKKEIDVDAYLAKKELKKLNKSRPELLAKDFEFYKNKFIQDLKELYPEKPWLCYVDKYFPNAEGGPVYFDEPLDSFREESLKEKEKFLKSRGYRYFIISPTKSYYEDLKEFK